ncbi:high-affinity zinc uptake system protein ZnuA [Roseibium sp. TrichSKD4]|nr:high-affinity zinc uptake system protein ZnuA [Roseibium sp. TrichSKD4]
MGGVGPIMSEIISERCKIECPALFKFKKACPFYLAIQKLSNHSIRNSCIEKNQCYTITSNIITFLEPALRPFSRPSSANSRASVLKSCTALAAFSLVMTPLAAAQADSPTVVTSIKPVHSLVSAVMQGVGEPTLLIDGANSPHGYALKPSQAGALQDADIVFWIGEDLAPSLKKPIDTLSTKATVVELMDTKGISHLDFREGATFEAHDHGDEDHDGHDHNHEKHTDHKHDDHDHDHEKHTDHKHDDHDHDDEKYAEHKHDDHGHDHGGKDPHIWLNPDNGKAMLKTISATLSEADPNNAALYQKNADAMSTALDNLSAEIEGSMKNLENTGFIVFHDAYHHFEHRYDVEAAGAITLSPETAPSADRVTEIRATISEIGARCVFSEPQFEPKIVATVIEGTGAKTATLDPLGANLANGPDLYPQLIANLAKSLKDCLASSS